METANLKRRGGKWFVRYNVPRPLRASVGKPELLKTTGTGDLSLARQRRAAILFELQREALARASGTTDDAYRATLKDIVAGKFDQPGADDSVKFEEETEANARTEGILMALDPNYGGDRLPTAQRRALEDALVSLRRGERLSIPKASGLSVELAGSGFMKAAKETVTGQTMRQHQMVLERLNAFVGPSTPLDEITRKTVADFFDSLGVTTATKKRYASTLNQLWKWAKNRGDASGDSPFAGQSFKTKKGEGTPRQAWEIKELNALFAADIDKQTALYWAPRIALFSGLRLNEICSLTGDDIKKEDGVSFFDIVRSKTDAGERRVPVHSKLIELGFLKFVTKGPAQIFKELTPGGPDLKLSWYLTKRFTVLRRSVGVTRPGVVFHSLRKNTATALEQARVPESEAVSILGHEKLSMSYSIYSIGLTLKQLQGIVEKIKYAGLKLR